jgi:hypothetical protein
MMRTLSGLLVCLSLLSASCRESHSSSRPESSSLHQESAGSRPESTSANNGPTLEEDEIQIDLRLFNNREVRGYEFQATATVNVGYRVALSESEVALLRLGGGNGFQHTVRITQLNGAGDVIATFEGLHGGGTEFRPIEGSIRFQVANLLDQPMSILVYHE